MAGSTARTEASPTYEPGEPGYGPDDRDDRPTVTSPESAADVFASFDWPDDREACAMAVLDTRHRVIALETVSIGSLDHTFTAPREIYRTALTHPTCAAIVLAHNHPSGDRSPSSDDVAVTVRLDKAGTLLGIDLLDHLVVVDGAQGWTSMARHGHL